MQRALLSALAALAALGLPAAGIAQSPVPEQTAGSAARRAKALELAQIVEPREAAADSAKLETQHVEALLAVEHMRELEAEYPGIALAMWRAIGPELDREMNATLPAHWEKLADIYTSRLTLQQLDEAIAFLGGPTGRKMIRLMNEAAIAPAVVAGVNSADAPLSEAAFADLKDTAAKEMVDGLTDEEQLKVAAFGQSAAGLALLSIAPLVQQASLEWMNASNAATDAHIDAIAAKTMDDFIAASDRAKGNRKR